MKKIPSSLIFWGESCTQKMKKKTLLKDIRDDLNKEKNKKNITRDIEIKNNLTVNKREGGRR